MPTPKYEPQPASTIETVELVGGHLDGHRFLYDSPAIFIATAPPASVGGHAPDAPPPQPISYRRVGRRDDGTLWYVPV